MIDLYDRVPRGTRVVIRSYAQSVELEGEEAANRGLVLEPNIIDPDVIYGTGEDEVDVDDVEDEVTAQVDAGNVIIRNDPLGSDTISGG